MKKLQYGISNFEQLINENYYYVDKTNYIEQLENVSERNIMFLRPRKFGKTLFTSTIEYYYDINSANKFDKLFRDTYIGKNPTSLKNSYYILRFNFSGIDTTTIESTINGFRREVASSINFFVEKYKMDFFVNRDDSAEDILDNLFKAFNIQKNGEKIYVIIDEYDHFANELLGFSPDHFDGLVSQNGKVRKWYEMLKKGTESVVDRIFITGVAPITLDSLTSGFNIGKDLTRDERFNEMLGFTQAELIKMLKDLDIQEEQIKNILPVMKENYDGYKFSLDAEENMYNSNMCLFFLNEYLIRYELPRNLIDVNIASDYSKLEGLINLCTGEGKKEILEATLTNEGITTSIIEKFNSQMGFREQEFISMLFYLGYLTINGEDFGRALLKIPNQMMKEIYAEYFINVVNEEAKFRVSDLDYTEMTREIAMDGKIDNILEKVHKYLKNLSNRDYIKFDEKYVKLIFYCLAMNLKPYRIISEQENNKTYQDIMLIPRDQSKGYQAILIEFKYLKKEEAGDLEKTKKEAIEQVEEYSNLEEIKKIPNLNKYVVVAVNDEIYVEKI